MVLSLHTRWQSILFFDVYNSSVQVCGGFITQNYLLDSIFLVLSDPQHIYFKLIQVSNLIAFTRIEVWQNLPMQ